MTIEEKAKAYDEALERAKAYHRNELAGSRKEMTEYIFPELRESEDERMRRKTINCLTMHNKGCVDAKDIDECIAWLEKQKEPDNEEGDFTIYHPQKNGDGKYECIPFSFYGSLTAFSNDKDLMDFLNECFYDKEECERWCEIENKPELPECKHKIKKDSYIDYLCESSSEEKQKEPEDKGEISDGYHTFNELYYYRMLYNAAFFNLLPKEWVHKSKKHHDGEECFGGGWFIVMANLPTGQVSNHYELKDWDLFQIPEKEIADEWDGHTPQEAAERIHKYLQEKQKEQKPANHNLTTWHRDVVYSAMCDKNLDEGLRCNLEVVYKTIKELVNRTPVVEEQKPAEWSEEDESELTAVIYCVSRAIKASKDENERNSLLSAKKWLQDKLSFRVKSLRPQPKQEWSEEDEIHIDFILESLEDQIRFCRKDAKGAYYAKQIRVAQNWLKEKLKSSGPSWKPSKEQM